MFVAPRNLDPSPVRTPQQSTPASLTLSPGAILSAETVQHVPHGVEKPYYNRDAMKVGVVALGASSRFFRGFVGDFLHDAMQMHPHEHRPEWGVCAVAMRHGDEVHKIAKQDGLYTLVEKGCALSGKESKLKVIGCIKEALFLGEAREAVLERMCAQDCKLVTLTVTEAGYYLRPDRLGLNLSAPEIQADLLNPRNPSTPVGLIVEALRRRWEIGLPFFTALSCDNLAPTNGALLRQTIFDYVAALKDNELYDAVIGPEFDCPTTMVDRIVPKETPSNRDFVLEHSGLVDHCSIFTEPKDHRHLVLELADHAGSFARNNPFLHQQGAVVTHACGPYASVKETLVNATHVVIALLGEFHAGKDHIHEVMHMPALRAVVRKTLFDELVPSIAPPDENTRLDEWAERTLERFSNSGLPDGVARISNNSANRLHRVMQPIKRLLEQDTDGPPAPFDGLTEIVAMWVVTRIAGVRAGNIPVEVVEPEPILQVISAVKDAVSFRKRWDDGHHASVLNDCAQRLATQGLFGEAGHHPRFRDSLHHALERVAGTLTH